MTCREARRMMIPFLDGELKDPTDFDAHLKICAQCRRELEGFQRSFDLTIGKAKETEAHMEPSPYLLAELNRKIDALESDSLWNRLAGAIAWMDLKKRIPEIACAVGFLVLFISLSGRVHLYRITENPSGIPQCVEQRLELRIGHLSPIEIVRFRGLNGQPQ